MPQRHEREDYCIIKHSSDSGQPGPRVCTPEGNVDVADEEFVVTPVPAAPEGYCGRIIGQAADHVFWGVDAVDQGPEAEESPREKKFQPKDVEVEIGEERELGGRVVGPVGIALGDCDAVVEVEEKFHCEETEQESDPIFGGPGSLDTCWTILGL
jgi:hypothetical protein